MSSVPHSTGVHELDRAELGESLDDFCRLSYRVVEAGAHLGWEVPLDASIAKAYWAERASALDGYNVILFAAYAHDALVGTVQLERGHFETSRHRGEVAKLIVDPQYRRRGYGAGLMDALESRAVTLGMEVLVLDTRPGEPVERLYEARGYLRTGLVPNWMKYRSGEYRATVFYYKLLTGT